MQGLDSRDVGSCRQSDDCLSWGCRGQIQDTVENFNIYMPGAYL